VETDEEIEEFARRIGLEPHQPWYQYGWESPGVLISRLRNKHRPVFRMRMACQRATRGYGDEDLWSLNNALAKLTVVGCRSLREEAFSYPLELGGWEAWEDILRRIEDGFQAWLDEDGWFSDDPAKEAMFKDAMDLYAHWFSGLWN